MCSPTDTGACVVVAAELKSLRNGFSSKSKQQLSQEILINFDKFCHPQQPEGWQGFTEGHINQSASVKIATWAPALSFLAPVAIPQVHQRTCAGAKTHPRQRQRVTSGRAFNQRNSSLQALHLPASAEIHHQPTNSKH